MVPVLLALAVAFGGCTSVPKASGPTLSVAEARTVDPAELARPIEVRWGGTIAEVSNTAQGTTVLEIVSRPLRLGGRPRAGDTSEGRFLAEVDTFLDPEIVVPGRDVTVTGRLDGQREGRIGETPYRYPVVRVADYRYWTAEPSPVHLPYPPIGSADNAPFWHYWPHGLHGPHVHHRRGAYVSGGVRF